MPLSIPLRHIKRMFPFEFYYEFNEIYKDYQPANTAFAAKTIAEKQGNTMDFDTMKKLYEDFLTTNETALQNATLNNVVDSNTIGFPYLILAPYVDAEDILNNEKGRLLCVQYFTNDATAIFTKSLPLESVRKIPEILHDDPNLFIGLLNPKEERMEILKLAEPIKAKFLERKNQDETTDQNN